MQNREEIMTEQGLAMLLDQMALKIGDGTAQPYELSQMLIAISSIRSIRAIQSLQESTNEVRGGIAQLDRDMDELFDLLLEIK